MLNYFYSMLNYEDYLNSDIFKDDMYIIPLLLEASEFKDFNLNVIIFEELNGIIKIKYPLDNFESGIYNNYHWDNYIFIYKKDIYYEPIYFKESEDKYISIIPYSNKYFKKIIDNIENILKKEVSNENNIKELLKILSKIKYKPNKLLINSTNKITHIITTNGNIIPIIPIGNNVNILDNFNINTVIYDLNDVNLPTYSKVLMYIELMNKYISESNKYVISGIVVEKNKVVNIYFKNGLYIPIKSEIYNKKKHIYKIISYVNLFTIDNNLDMNINQYDKRSEFINNYNYELNINDIFNKQLYIMLNKDNIKNKEKIIVSNINDFKLNDYYLMSKRNIQIDDISHTIYEVTTLFETSINKIDVQGLVTSIKSTRSPNLELYPNWGEIEIYYNSLNEINKIINDEIRLKEHKRILLYPLLSKIASNFVKVVNDSDFDNLEHGTFTTKYCSTLSKVECKFPCKYDSDGCKLYIKKTSIITNNNLIDKLIYKFIDLLLINGIDKLYYIIQNNIEPDKLHETIKENELFFTYVMYIKEYLNEVFSIKNKFINKTIKNEIIFNKQPDKKNNIMRYLDNSPIIVRNILGKSTYISLYKNKPTNYTIISKILSSITDKSINISTLKSTLIEYVSASFIQSKFKNKSILYDVDKYNSDDYKLNIYDLDILSKMYDIGFLLISKQYSKEDSKYETILIINNNLIKLKNTETINYVNYINK